MKTVMKLLTLIGGLLGVPSRNATTTATAAFLPPLAYPHRRIRIRRQSPMPEAWMHQYQTLQAYRRLHPNDWPKSKECFPDGNRLGLWCRYQRHSHKEGRLSSECVRQLNAIRFPWDGRYYWYCSYQMLVAFREKHPNRWPTCREEWPPGNTIGEWCHSQRTMHRRGQLSPNKTDLLNLIRFEWVSTYHEDVARCFGRNRRSA